jgi:preprotein translocase subunit SecG
MFTTLIILAIIASILLIFIVLIQKPKGGGIAANFSGGNQIMGVKRTNDFVEKATWTLSAALLVFVLASNAFYSNEDQKKSILEDRASEVTPGDFQNNGNMDDVEGSIPLNGEQN